jgi:hypothetical protein
MKRRVLEVALLAGMLAAICGIASRGIAAPDQGKSLVLLPQPSRGTAGPCDRACLYKFVDKYFDALASHCACGIALAPDVKYTENGQLVTPGEGIWKTFTGRGTYRVYLADPTNGVVGYYGDYNEFRMLQGVIALRLKVKDHQITEVETILDRQQLRPGGGLSLNTAGVMTPVMINELKPAGFVSPDAILLKPVAASERMTRDQLIATADQYYAGFAQGKGSVVPFADNCSQRDNGIAATNNSEGPAVDPAQASFRVYSQSCAGELDRGFFSALTKLGEKRYWVVDDEQGLALSLALFDNEGNVKSVAVPGVGNVTVPRAYLRPITFLSPQLFKIEGGKIVQIEALSWPVPYGMRSGWSK